MKRLGFRKKLLLLLLSTIFCVSVVFATTTLVYDWTLTFTASTPKVRFYKWSDQTLHDTIDLPYNIYADLWAQDSNATHGIKNTDTSNHTVYLYVDSINATTKVHNVTIWVQSKNASSTKATVTWQGGSLPTSEQSFTAVASTEYILKIWLKGASTVADVLVSLKMKVAE